MRALLINPWVYDFKCHDFWIKPLGLLKLSSLLKQSGVEVSMIDCMDRAVAGIKNTGKSGRGKYFYEEILKPEAYNKVPRKYKRYGMPLSIFKEKLESAPEPDIIISTSNMTYSYEGTHLAIKMLKERFPLKRIFLGGIYATLCKSHAEKRSGADFVLRGNIGKDFIRAVNFVSGFRVPETGIDEFEEVLPDYSFYPSTPYAAVRFTAGCPFQCSYCSIKQFRDGYYQRKAENVIKELKEYEKAGIKNITFYDDALLYKNRYIKSLLKEILSSGMKFSFHTPNGLHAAYVDDELAALMKETGFTDIRVSLETANYEIQEKTGGKVHNEQFRNALEALKKAGFRGGDIGVYILAGLPGQNAGHVETDIEYLKNAGVKVKLANYSPVPGTSDFMRIKPDVRGMIASEPLLQNEFYFMFMNPEYGWEDNEKMREAIRKHNSLLEENKTSYEEEGLL